MIVSIHVQHVLYTIYSVHVQLSFLMEVTGEIIYLQT